jgi:hypothetical protein
MDGNEIEHRGWTRASYVSVAFQVVSNQVLALAPTSSSQARSESLFLIVLGPSGGLNRLLKFRRIYSTDSFVSRLVIYVASRHKSKSEAQPCQIVGKSPSRSPTFMMLKTGIKMWEKVLGGHRKWFGMFSCSPRHPNSPRFEHGTEPEHWFRFKAQGMTKLNTMKRCTWYTTRNSLDSGLHKTTTKPPLQQSIPPKM